MFLALGPIALALFFFSWEAQAKNSDLLAKTKKIHGGKNYEITEPIEVNRDYRLDHHQKQGEFDYFRLHLPPDNVVTLEIQTLQKGIAWNKGHRVVTTEPWAGLELQDANKKSLLQVEIAGKTETTQKNSIRNRNPNGGDYYLLVGSSKGSMHKDQVLFKISLTPFSHGDLGTDQDAGANSNAAMPMMTGHEYAINSLGGDDLKDFFTFSALKQEWYNLIIRGEDPLSTALEVTVLSPNQKKKLASYVSGGADQIITHSFEIPKDGQYFVEVKLMSPSKEKNVYSMELSKVVRSSKQKTDSLNEQ